MSAERELARRVFAELLLEWSRSLEEHGLPFEDWLRRHELELRRRLAGVGS